MRLWSLHPKYLDTQGLVALWREALLARAVLGGRTRGYRHHPQLTRFLAHNTPRWLINTYLRAVHDEARARGYRFDCRKIGPTRPIPRVPVTTGQLRHEWRHLQRKLAVRSPYVRAKWRSVAKPELHPLFRLVAGPVADWERAG
jgi:hypothetical protein